MNALTNPHASHQVVLVYVAKHDWKLDCFKRIIYCNLKVTSAVFAKIIRLLIADVTTAERCGAIRCFKKYHTIVFQ